MSSRSSIKSMPPSDKGSRASSSKAAQARAKADAAHVRVDYGKRAAKLKMEGAAKEAEIQKEKAAREMEAAAREAEIQLEMTRILAELEVLKLEGEEEAAKVEAEYIEEAEGLHNLTDVRSTSERTRLERTSDYVRSQIDRKPRPSSPYVFDNIPCHEEPQADPIASHPYDEDNLPSQLRDEVKNERADDKYFLTPNLQYLGRRDAEVKFRTANSIRNVRPQSYTR
ncbi:uncharacterized protein LOC132393826 [Hypanus sabinus]|uniref:uncharacterized protein LOC132393826 n=1 Tax=Hypanus sabinus TaxID=79690 RepID=UPI0028C3EEC5|nr:uncharacterized protein LOC132393826 [Hypanus sabinus]